MNTNTLIKAFSSYQKSQGTIDTWQDEWPTTLSFFESGSLSLPEQFTHYGFVQSGRVTVSSQNGDFVLSPGMYFSLPGLAQITSSQDCEAIIMSRHLYNGVFIVGGPIEANGRLAYIDGCTDSCLIQPVKAGDPCLNALYFPPGVKQTAHTHPSNRVGIIVSGSGVCVTSDGKTPLTPGQVFCIHQDGVHHFETDKEPLVVIAYHPDSDFGPTDQCHPMINRTIVNGLPASQIDSIRTKKSHG
jgi:quercetin dioxygenase-like cupin family protein